MNLNILFIPVKYACFMPVEIGQFDSCEEVFLKIHTTHFLLFCCYPHLENWIPSNNVLSIWAGEDERPTDRNNRETKEPWTTTMVLNNSNVCNCGKVCNRQRNLTIHMGYMGCKTNLRSTQRTGQPGETEELIP